MLKIDIYTDGSCTNPGVGGYGAIMLCAGEERIVRGHTKQTTNNRMELQPMISAIDWLNTYQKKPCEIVFHTDSKYVMDCALGRDKDGNKRKVGWFKGRKNEDLWMEFINKVINGKHVVRWVKVKGHSGDMYNERANKIANEERIKARHELSEGRDIK